MVWAVPRSLATTWGMLSFPLGTKMFQFPRFPSHGLCVQPWDPRGLHWGVSPFGHPRIVACTRLLEAFRSVPRPSSAFGAIGIHRKPCVASSRDKEKSQLFLLTAKLTSLFLLLMRLRHYVIGKVLSGRSGRRPLTAEACLSRSFVRSRLRPSTSAIFNVPRDKTARQIAGPQNSRAIFAFYFIR